MKAIKIILLIAIALVSLVACGGGEKAAAPKGPREVFQPDWYGIQDPTVPYVYTYGTATKVSQNSSYDAAYANAMLEAAQYVEQHVKGMVKNFEEEVGGANPTVNSLVSKAVKAVSSAKFSGTMVTQRKSYQLENSRYQSFVRVAIPKEEINKNLIKEVKKEEEMYNRFRSAQAFKELEAATE